MRKRGICLMDQTYRDAAAVLVVDAGIRSCSLRAPHEKLLRVLSPGGCSGCGRCRRRSSPTSWSFEYADGTTSLRGLISVGEDLLDVPKTNLAAELFRLSKRGLHIEEGPTGCGRTRRSRSLAS
ncbi:hypothetical protein BKA93DRAFT_773953 [Sparassis latifolia]